MNQYSRKFKTYLDRILAQLPAKTPVALKNFVEVFYDKMPLMEIETLDARDAAQMATSSYQFMQTRKAGEIKIDVKSAKAGAQEKTIIEVINDDKPFLVDSILAELARLDLTPHVILHPVLRVKRNAKGALQEVHAREKKDASLTTESMMHIELAPLPEGITEARLKTDLERVFRAVGHAVADWRAILAKLPENLALVDKAPRSFQRDDVNEAREFLEWLENNFVFLGYVEYDFSDPKKNGGFAPVRNSELGLFKLEDPDFGPKGLSALPQEVHRFLRQPEILQITKSNSLSPVHRPTHMDYVSIKRFDKAGKVIGENRFLGLFTSRVYYQSTDDIPIIRRKITRTLSEANLSPTSHSGKALKAILEFFPRDELFQISEEDLFHTGMGILSLDTKPDVRFFLRRDVFERFVSCMIYVPRDRFSTYQREKIQEIVERAYDGRVTAYYTQMTDSPLARLHIVVKTTPGKIPNVQLSDVEAEISKVTNVWSDTLQKALVSKHGDRKAGRLFRTHKNAFPANYTAIYGADSAVFDIEKISEAISSGNLALDLFRKKQDAPNFVRLKVYNPKQQVPLSDILPMMENFGFRVLDENPYLIVPKEEGNESHVWVRDLRLTMPSVESLDVDGVKPLFEEALANVWHGRMERAYAKYLKQTGLAYSQDFIIAALTSHPQIVRKLVELFHARFNLDAKKKGAAGDTAITNAITKLLGGVTNIAEDRVIRLMVNAITSTLRTNFFQKSAEGKRKDYLSFKFDSRALLELPLPRPFREIFVYSMRTEGIHLRGGRVARGGLRWSDRHEDFRTEVLGLMKAQMVKNAIIVPVGSKGGFVVKQPPKEGGREAFLAEGIECYKTFLRGLLDITDNINTGKVVPPKDVVRHDQDDPYLVVAADKGTATFSDIANSISKEYGFWLGDAFASGGSAGYDHKKMGITARGGWVSVMRHSRELGMDITKDVFTCAGVGDLAGDVFGNGMLLSDKMKLVAAFNHMHIFLDPNPDTVKSFKERNRMFYLPRSSWSDYDAKLISAGGGIYLRSEKSIPITNEVRAVLGLGADVKALSPDELIKAILRAPVDLLWNGGIGTYVKAKTESHEDVGDRSNNAVRINGGELRCKIVGEGGNLGFTQRGRIEYARKGGRINTDALDNSAGVSCSDHEVNIKIALRAAVEKGKLTTKTRDVFLAGMTDEVAALVLRDNELQNQALSIAEAQGHHILESRARLMRAMEKSGLLNREIEYLPSEEELAERRAKKQGFTRPELAVILAYSKLALYQEMLDSALPDDPYYELDLKEYFPVPMQTKFGTEIAKHQLRREIVATVLTNSMINRVGAAFFLTMAEDNSVETCDVARAFTVTRDAFDLRPLWADIEGLTGKVKAWVQAEMFVEINHFVTHTTGWFLRNVPQPIDIGKAMEIYAKGVKEFMAFSKTVSSDAIRNATEKKLAYYLSLDVPKPIAERIAVLESMASALDVVRVSLSSKLPVKTVGEIYFEIGQRLRLGWLRVATGNIVTDSQWDRLAITSISNDLFEQQRRLTLDVIQNMGKKDSADAAYKKWSERNALQLERLRQFMTDLEASEVVDCAKLVVALRNIQALSTPTKHVA